MIQECADHLATLDCLQSFASVAQQFDYCRPEFTEESHVLMLEKAKHPVLQKNNSLSRSFPILFTPIKTSMSF